MFQETAEELRNLHRFGPDKGCLDIVLESLRSHLDNDGFVVFDELLLERLTSEGHCEEAIEAGIVIINDMASKNRGIGKKMSTFGVSRRNTRTEKNHSFGTAKPPSLAEQS